MDKIIQNIRAPIENEMKIFENSFYKNIYSKISLLNDILLHILKKKGKQIRPIFVFLIAKMLGKISKKTYDTALLVQLIHTGALLHDDVVDNSNIRRGTFSVKAIWKSKVAILVGDYLLSKSLLIAENNKYYDLLKIISKVIENMSEGELLQIEKTYKLDITEYIYYKIIYKKTASLISTCCEGAALSVEVNNKIAMDMNKFGQLIGMAFQIKDDLLDFEKKNFLKKPIGIDIKERKITLPIIYVLKNTSNKRKKWIKDIIIKHNKNTEKVNNLIDYVKNFGGIDYANKKMIVFRKKALKIINIYANGEIKKSLKIMINYITERNN